MMKSSALMKKESKMRIRAFPVSNSAARNRGGVCGGGEIERVEAESPSGPPCVRRPSCPLPLPCSLVRSSLASTLHAPCRSLPYACMTNLFILRPSARRSDGGDSANASDAYKHHPITYLIRTTRCTARRHGASTVNNPGPVRSLSLENRAPLASRLIRGRVHS